jgi:hypothetical protein
MSSYIASAPIVGAATWLPVMRAAGFRCQCTGGCGRSHVKDKGRCRREHTDLCRLIAAPANPTGDPHRDATAPLVAYCPNCFDGAKTATSRAATAARAQAAADAPSLFDL